MEPKSEDEHNVESRGSSVSATIFPEWALAPEQTPLSQQTMIAAANDVHIVTGWVLANLGEGRLVVQCAVTALCITGSWRVDNALLLFPRT